jgi:glutamine amidotransferase
MKIGILALTTSNYNSIGRALKWIGKEPIFVNSAKELNNLSHLILPGVSKFKSVMDELREREFVSGLEMVKNAGKPILGLCAGMQVMGFSSLENPGISGLKWFNFEVEPIRIREEGNLRTFHTGWNEVYSNQASDFSSLPGIFYFNHSYCVRSIQKEFEFGTTVYGSEFISVIRKDNLVGAQFHPEKSQSLGLKFIEDFLSL